MTSRRLKPIYNSQRWRKLRRAVIAQAGGRCQAAEWDDHLGDYLRCPVTDLLFGGTESLIVDHRDPHHPDPYDEANLQALCHRHSGKKDGPRARRARTSRAVW